MIDNKEKTILDDKKFDLLDLIDKNLLQELQDNFANAMNVASLIYDTEKPVTEPTGFVDFCIKSRGNEIGAKMCQDCDLKWGKIAADSGKPVIYNCHAGLVDFVVPIMVENQHIGSFFGGQILFAPPNEENIREFARKIGVDENKYIEAAKKVKIVSEDNIKAAANLLYIVTNTISEIAHKNLELKRNSKRKTLYKDIVSIIRSSLDINEVKEKIVNVIGHAFGADRCFIIEYDKVKNTFLTVKNEYLSSENITRYKGADVNEDVPNFMEEFKKGNYLVIDNKKVFINNTPQEYETEKNTIEKVNVNSAYGIPIIYKGELYSVLGIHYIGEKHTVNQEEIKLLISISEQIAIAIYHAKLYDKINEQAKRENLLKNIIDKIRSSLDIEETLSFICEETAKLFNIQRIAITMIPDINNLEEYTTRKEYKKIPEIKGIDNLLEPNKIFYYWANKLIHGDKILVIDNIEESDTPDYFRNSYKDTGVKSLIGASIRKGSEIWGILVLSEYNNYRQWSKEEKELLSVIADQTFIAINQAELFEKEKSTLEREKLLRSILAKALTTFDLNQMKQIVSDIGKLTKADRCYFVETSEDERSGKKIHYEGEYLASSDIKSAIGYTFPTEEVHKFVEMYLKAKDLIVFDYEKILEDTDEEYEGMRTYIKRFGLKSGVGIPLFYEGKLHAVLAIEYTKAKILPTKDELEFYKLLGNQTGMVLNQIKLYENTKKTAEREKLLRNITEKIRSSLEIKETLSFICEEVSNLFNVQRVTVVEFYDKNNLQNWIVRKEYKKNVEVKGLNDIDYPKETGSYNGRTILQEGKNLIVDNINEADLPDYYKETYKKMGVKSILSVPIKSDENFFGIIFLSATNEYRKWKEDDVKLLETIAAQIYIAIKQAELFEKEKLTAERERISRNIIEILRSSIDKTIIKKLFVKNIGKFFNADRVIFSEYDNELNAYLPVDNDSEYLSSANEKSYIGFDWSNSDAQSWIKPLLEKREMRITDWEEYVNQGHEINDFILSLLKESKIKSKYGFPIIYQNNLMGFFCLEFTKKTYNLSNEDIERIRSICTQAGIALYHANLYQDAQQCKQYKETLKENFLDKIEKPTQEILNTSVMLSQKEFDHEVKLEYLNNIIKSCNQLIELTTYINKDLD